MGEIIDIGVAVSDSSEEATVITESEAVRGFTIVDSSLEESERKTKAITGSANVHQMPENPLAQDKRAYNELPVELQRESFIKFIETWYEGDYHTAATILEDVDYFGKVHGDVEHETLILDQPIYFK